MRLSWARSITYTVVGALAIGALRLTPPVPAARAGELLSAREIDPLRVLGSDRAATPIMPYVYDPIVSPVLVVANSKTITDTVVVAGTIRSSLYSALDQFSDTVLPKGQRLRLAWLLADIYEYRVDMSKDLQVGDKFGVVVERVQQPTGGVYANKILGATMELSGREIQAIHFRSNVAGGEYFDAEGKSMRAAFLRAPLNFRRISSVFGMRRHPVLGRWRAHKGTDYAAASGTPVRAVGDGVVIFAGRKGGYGNVIDIRHRNGYVSRYAHLRAFGKGVGRGKRVGIGSTIGYVGMTGLASGPHLHFEVLVSGVQKNPRVALQMRGGDPIGSSERNTFLQQRNRALAFLKDFSASTVGE
ncbi:MAG: peptidoglycan DD-metalloendopeptidase family protein [Gemmatimonadaceae bacterium]